ncbi:hypothetical protein BC629DRAFT_1599568 [Irpex lacteus]|nr:hypothetical protein BC629DRAFT_1599568 [Irpex lacteus]
MATLQPPKFHILSNRHDDSHSQPPSFKIPLRPEQLRSLTWMLRQEAADAPPFMEEEIFEAILHPLGQRVEGRPQRPNRVRGDVLQTESDVQKEFSRADEIPGKIAVKGTLVIAPPHLTGLWEFGCKKFARKRFKVVDLTTALNLNFTSVEDITEDDVIIVASNLFRSGVYLENLADFAAAGGLPEKQDGLYFDARLEVTLRGLEKQVDLLQNSRGPEQVLAKIRAALKKDEATEGEVVSRQGHGSGVRDGGRGPASSQQVCGHSPTWSPSVKAETTADDDSDVPVQHRRSAVKRKVITLSHDEHEPAPFVKKSAKTGKSKKDASLDYEASSDEDGVMEVDSEPTLLSWEGTELGRARLSDTAKDRVQPPTIRGSQGEL